MTAVGYSQQPVELFGVAPPGKLIKDLFSRDSKHGDYLTLAAIDVYSDQRYEIYWGENGEVRRRGDDCHSHIDFAVAGASFGDAVQRKTALRRTRRRQRFYREQKRAGRSLHAGSQEWLRMADKGSGTIGPSAG